MKKYVLLNVLFGIALFLFVISFSIALPIMCRFIHTLCIKPMHIVEDLNAGTNSNYTFDDVVEAYNEVVNYCCFYTKFGAGKLLYPEEDVLHFEDCRKLFTLDFVVIIVSLIIIITLKIIEKKKKVVMFKPLTYLITGISTIVLPTVLGILCAINFDEAFVIFHHIFFPGKENWLFNPSENHIIWILPQDFFMVCAIVIGASVVIGSTLLILFFFIKRKKIVKMRKANA